MSDEPICASSHELDIVLKNTATALRGVGGQLAQLEGAVLKVVSQSSDAAMDPKTVQQFDLLIQTVSEIGLFLERLSVEPKPSIVVNHDNVAAPIRLEALRMMITGQEKNEAGKTNPELDAGVSLF